MALYVKYQRIPKMIKMRFYYYYCAYIWTYISRLQLLTIEQLYIIYYCILVMLCAEYQLKKLNSSGRPASRIFRDYLKPNKN